MWPEEIHCPMVVGLSEMDKLVPVHPIRRFLLSYPLSRATPISPSGPGSGSKIRKRARSSRSLRSSSTDEDSRVKISRPESGEDVLLDWNKQGETTIEANRFDADRKAPRKVEVLFWPGHVHGTTMVDPSALEEFDRVCRQQEQAFVVKRFS